MLTVTTPLIEGKKTLRHADIVSGVEILGANGVAGVDLDYETIGSNGSMLMVGASGTAVVLEQVRRSIGSPALRR